MTIIDTIVMVGLASWKIHILVSRDETSLARGHVMDHHEAIENHVAANAEADSAVYMPSLQITEGHPSPIAANGGLSYVSFDRDGDRGTSAAIEAALNQIAEGHVQAFIDRIESAPTGPSRLSGASGSGYARVSKADGSQSLDLQRNALCGAGVDTESIYHDFASGARDDRPGLKRCLRGLRKGDVLVAWKLDRIGRNLAHLVNTVQNLSGRSVGLRVLAGRGAQIDTTTTGRHVFGTFATLAEFEHDPRAQRRQEVRAIESPGTAGAGRDGKERHIGDRTL